jgi:hypothetical protein
MLGGTAYAANRVGRASAERGYAVADQTAAPATDVVGELTKLKGLLDAGALTQDEFAAAKRRLLGT